MKIYEAAYNDMIEESSFETISIHKTREGAEKALAEHKAKVLAQWKEYYPTEQKEPYPFGRFEAWRIFESELLD